MNISEKIKYYTENLNIKFAKNNVDKMLILSDEIKRYLKKELKGERNLQFTSQDLRSFTIAIEKIHKQVNKKISFIEIQKRLDKKNKVGNKELVEETKNTATYIALARDLQCLSSWFNYNAMLTYLLELEIKQKKEKDDDLFNNMVLMGIIEAM